MENQFKQIASLIGSPVRAAILWTMIEGKAFTATELAISADTSPQNISMHLARLVQAGLLRVENHGRHRYYTYSRKEIAYAIEAMATLMDPSLVKTSPINDNYPAIKYCRTCYDHLAGKLAVAITEKMLDKKIIVYRKDAMEVSTTGRIWFTNLNIDIEELKQQRRSFLRPCLDWSERVYHIAGSLAAALLDKMLSDDWIRKTRNSRKVIITSNGQKKLYEHLKLTL
ncbi:MAG TPA: helix-turn-helix domain-containing protein [Chitinophagaceae bacterium]|nr:helix-turn-helix domain-containing protein [Chitinophagaceae bacterium]